MDARIDLLIRQAADSSSQLQVFLTAPGRQDAFVVPSPSQLLTLQQVWRQRFLKHHDPAFVWAEGAAVVRSYSEQLRQGLQQWIESPAWKPLQRLLADLQDLPLTVRLDGVDGALRSLPWEALSLQRPIWRLDGDAPAAGSSAPMRARKPRILLLVGSEAGLSLDGEVERLLAQQRNGRIRLTVLRGQSFTPAALRNALAQSAGWDAVLYLGHTSAGPNGGVLHLGDGSQLDGQALEADLGAAASHRLRLFLFNSCSGLQLAERAVRAGIDWAVCFLEPVPSAAAALAFAQLLEALETGCDLQGAIDQTRQVLAWRNGFEGCELLLAAVATPTAEPYRLPLRRRRQLVLRLATSKRTQAVAVGAFVAVALVMELTPTNPLNSYLLDRRLDVQRMWRQVTRQPGPRPGESHPPIPVLLLDPETTIPQLTNSTSVDHTPWDALTEVLKRTSASHVPVVGFDVLFDKPRPGASELADEIRRYPSRKIIGGFAGPNTDGTIKTTWLETSPLKAAGMEPKDLAVGTPAGGAKDKPIPLYLVADISEKNFAGALSHGNQKLLPSDTVIDWSIDWRRWIQFVTPNDLPKLKVPLLLVGTSGALGEQSVDLFEAPVQSDRSLWTLSKTQVPGVLLQAVLIQSLNLRHWLIPLSLTLCTAATGALGFVLAALLEQRQHRLIALALIAAAACPLVWSLAIWQLWLVPLLLPMLAMGATTLCRDD